MLGLILGVSKQQVARLGQRATEMQQLGGVSVSRLLFFQSQQHWRLVWRRYIFQTAGYAAELFHLETAKSTKMAWQCTNRAMSQRWRWKRDNPYRAQ